MSLVFRCVKVMVLTLLGAAPVAAQGFEIAVKGGVGLSSLTDVSEVTSTSDRNRGRRLGPIFGVSVGVDLGVARLSLQPELLYSDKGAALDVSSNDDSWLRLRYLEVPLLAKLTAPSGGDEKALYVLAGPSLGFLMSARSRADDEENDVKGLLKDTDFGVTFGGGLQGRRWLVEGRYTLGLADIGKDTRDAVRTRAIVVLAGLRF